MKNLTKLLTIPLSISALLLVSAELHAQQEATHGSMIKADHSSNNRIKLKPLDISVIEKIVQVKGKENNGEYKITVPQNDLDINVDGFKIIPPMGLGTWIAFTPAHDGAMIMGILLLLKMI
ncbi:Domain of Uncharacterised Function (DUF1259) [Sphingobacterium multivorum]|uniref:Domain of Uncharacterized Function (DUF1259) n=1 Tax=Sphingobacterium multivorum TaxID=28454 RepID=A0A2X2JE08_SPHMU|nr:DUF1259 domain-containing protein [Sphingobacterium multivorum]SPZ92542.1 Domain of Uncharacterised Function (DUF1259) [Sphingobacterium multivorum]